MASPVAGPRSRGERLPEILNSDAVALVKDRGVGVDDVPALVGVRIVTSGTHDIVGGEDIGVFVLLEARARKQGRGGGTTKLLPREARKSPVKFVLSTLLPAEVIPAFVSIGERGGGGA